MSQAVSHEKPATCSTSSEQSSSATPPKKVPRLDDHDFQSSAVLSPSSSTRQEHLQVSPRKLTRISSQTTSSELRYYHSSNISQDNQHLLAGPSTSHPIAFRNVEEPTINPDDIFEIFLDVHEYKPNELKVKVVDNFMIIDGEHEERLDDISLISQQFTRKYEIPEELNKAKITCFISSDGILSILGPKNLKKTDRDIPIIPVNKPTKMTPLMKHKELEKKLIQSVKNQSIMEQSSLVKPQQMQESVSQQSEIVPMTEEQGYVPENMVQENGPEPNNN